MNKNTLSLASLALLLILHVTYAGSGVLPRVHANTSNNKQYLFIVAMPELDENYKVTFKGNGKAYKLKKDGSMQLLWEIPNWYTHKAHISNDGKFLVTRAQPGLWFKFADPTFAVSFYKEGKLIKQFMVKDLFIDPRNETVKHWEEINQEYPRIIENKYFLKTYKGNILEFNITTGELLSKKE
jgi:hypothetical protein